MIVKKSGGTILGLQLTAAERKAMNIEIQKSLAEYNRRNLQEVDAIALWILHSEFGFGEKRLKKFKELFLSRSEELNRRYEITDQAEELWVYTKLLRDDGINIEEL